MTTSPSSPNAARYLLTVRSLTPVCGVIAEMGMLSPLESTLMIAESIVCHPYFISAFV